MKIKSWNPSHPFSQSSVLSSPLGHPLISVYMHKLNNFLSNSSLLHSETALIDFPGKDAVRVFFHHWDGRSLERLKKADRSDVVNIWRNICMGWRLRTPPAMVSIISRQNKEASAGIKDTESVTKPDSLRRPFDSSGETRSKASDWLSRQRKSIMLKSGVWSRKQS